MENFTLLGHDCPYGRYPAPVVPIGRMEGHGLVAIIPGEDGPAIENLTEDSSYVHYSSELRQRLRAFDYRSERLFAFGAHDVACYRTRHEKRFFRELLRRPRARLTSPFMRLIQEGQLAGR